MHNIDFLPPQYREANAQRRTHMWRVIVVAMGLGCLISGASYDYFQRGLLKSQLVAAEARYAASQLLGQRISEFESELFAAQDEAELYTYLDHPWPRSHIIAAVVTPLPKDIYLDRLVVAYRAAPRAVSRRDAVRSTQPQSADENIILRPAHDDLMQLRKQYDDQDLIVTLLGRVEDETSLHSYLAQLESSEWFTATELGDIQRDHHDGTDISRFRVELTVRPGYGQPDGPQPHRSGIASASSSIARRVLP